MPAPRKNYDKAVEMYNKGLSVPKIAIHYGICNSVMYKILKRRGVEFRDRNTTHGCSYRPEYKVWQGMIQRCTNEKHNSYKNYGSRNIIVCDRWRCFAKFFADMGKKPNKNFTIERINNDGNYEKSNCKWVSWSEQRHNVRILKTNTTGATGVCWNKKVRKYEAYIGANDKKIGLGFFALIEDAKKVRIQAEIKYWGKKRSLNENTEAASKRF